MENHLLVSEVTRDVNVLLIRVIVRSRNCRFLHGAHVVLIAAVHKFRDGGVAFQANSFISDSSLLITHSRPCRPLNERKELYA